MGAVRAAHYLLLPLLAQKYFTSSQASCHLSSYLVFLHGGSWWWCWGLLGLLLLVLRLRLVHGEVEGRLVDHDGSSVDWRGGAGLGEGGHVGA